MKKTPMARLDAIQAARADASPWLHITASELPAMSQAERSALFRKANTCHVLIRSDRNGADSATRQAAEHGEAMLKRAGLFRGAVTIQRGYIEPIRR